jgi:hypothetical protein
MKNKFIKPEIEILAFHCTRQAADSYMLQHSTKYDDQTHSMQLPKGNPQLGGVDEAGADLGVPYQYY